MRLQAAFLTIALLGGGLLAAGCHPVSTDDTDTGVVDTGDTDDTGETDTDTDTAAPTPHPDRTGLSGGGSSTLEGGGYQLKVTVGDPITVHERFDGEHVLRIGVGTTQDSKPE